MNKKKILISSFFIFQSLFCIGQNNRPNAFDKNDLRLDIKLPHFNHLSLNPNKEFRDNEFGFNGYGLGCEYNYKDHKFLEASFSLVLAFEFPVPAPIDNGV